MSATYIVVVFLFSRKLSGLDLIAFEQQFYEVVMFHDRSWFIMMIKSRNVDCGGKEIIASNVTPISHDFLV